MQKNRFWHLYIYLGLALLLWAVYGYFQEVVSYSADPRFDGNAYTNAYLYFKGLANEYCVRFPFHTRIVVPLLASLLPTDNVVIAFQTVNVIFTLLGIYMLWTLWKHMRFSPYTIALGMIWLLFHWTGIVRLYQSDPVVVDVPVFFLGAAWLWCLNKKGFLFLLPIIAFVGAIQKESMLVYAGVSLAYCYFMQYRSGSVAYKPIIRMLMLSFVVAVVTKALIGAYFPMENEDWKHTSTITVLRVIKTFFNEPDKLLRLPAALFMAYGAFIIYYFKSVRIKPIDQIALLDVLAWVSLLFTVIGGGDMTRIAFTGFPFVMTLFLLKLDKQTLRHKLFLLLLSIPLMRLSDFIPNGAIYWEEYSSWFPEYAPMQYVYGYLGYFLFCIIGIQLYDRKKEDLS